AACYNIKRLARMLEEGVDPFFKTRPSKTDLRPQTANA
ncbi:IS5/IS1182 family transposase, partial [Vandammella animalimorsus]